MHENIVQHFLAFFNGNIDGTGGKKTNRSKWVLLRKSPLKSGVKNLA